MHRGLCRRLCRRLLCRQTFPNWYKRLILLQWLSERGFFKGKLWNSLVGMNVLRENFIRCLWWQCNEILNVSKSGVWWFVRGGERVWCWGWRTWRTNVPRFGLLRSIRILRFLLVLYVLRGERTPLPLAVSHSWLYVEFPWYPFLVIASRLLSHYC